MHLEQLNAPPLITGLGVAAAAALPALENKLLSVPFIYIAIAQAVAYVLNTVAVAQPGRIDEEEAASVDHKRKKSDNKADVEAYLQTRLGRGMFAPAKWAFGIWPLIFLGEAVYTGRCFFFKPVDPIVPLLRQTAGGFIVANLFQVLWTASFRPKYDDGTKNIYISIAMMSGISYSLSRAHKVFSSISPVMPTARYVTLFLPQAMHFAWTAAAAIVNLNGNIASPLTADPKVVAWAGHLSAVAATALGVAVTLTRQAPVVGAVFTWSLAAVTAALTERAEKCKNVVQTRVGVFGLGRQQILCALGTVACAGATIYTAMQNKGGFSMHF